MDWDECQEIENLVSRFEGIKRLNEIRSTKLCDWVSGFHPRKLKCHPSEPDPQQDKLGSFNRVCKVQFDETNETWAVRFPQQGQVHLADEKTRAEVAAMTIVRQQTDIPIPQIIAWGVSSENELGVGPFIICTWVDGINLGDVLVEPLQVERNLARPFRIDLSDEAIEGLWRQIARFMLQLSQVDFERIGSVADPPNRPLTLKVHGILSVGGVEPSSTTTLPFRPQVMPCANLALMSVSYNTTFSSTVDHFNSVIDHDLRHLRQQENSVDDEDDARQKWIIWNVLRQLVPRFVRQDRGPFKLICDDFGPMNMLVDDAENLRDIAVLDWEWSYAGPSELFWCPPSWVLGQKPRAWEGDYGDPLLPRYYKYLDKYIDIMQEEEKAYMPPNTSDECLPSTRLRRSREDGSMWFYQIIQEAFQGPASTLITRLRASVPDFDELAAQVPAEETEEFVQEKMRQLERYQMRLAEVKERHKALLALFDDPTGLVKENSDQYLS